MHRCIALAKLGAGYVAPNPMVGAVLVCDDRIIGEGYHQKHGGPHAEVNCIKDAFSRFDEEATREMLKRSTIYVNLEPCAHFGKTPPCADLIIHHKIPKVVVGCLDPFVKVDGKGAEKLKAAGIDVQVGVLEKEAKELNKRFLTFHTLHRPYIILKWAQTADKKIAADGTQRLLISNEHTNRHVHKWRSEEVAILVGTNTALFDDPELTVRTWPGPSPIRLVIDNNLRLPSSLKIFNGKLKTIVFNTLKHEEAGAVIYWQISKEVNLVHQVVNALYHLQIQSVMVEGGARLLQSFIDDGTWDEIRVIENCGMRIGNGLPGPEFTGGRLQETLDVMSDRISTYLNQPV